MKGHFGVETALSIGQSGPPSARDNEGRESISGPPSLLGRELDKVIRRATV
jgi:hypothetical protein